MLLKDIESYRVEDLYGKLAMRLQDEVFADVVSEIEMDENDPEFERAYTIWTTKTFSSIMADLKNTLGNEELKVKRGSDGETEAVKFLRNADLPEPVMEKWTENALDFLDKE